jgi:hypothetical protein
MNNTIIFDKNLIIKGDTPELSNTEDAIDLKTTKDVIACATLEDVGEEDLFLENLSNVRIKDITAYSSEEPTDKSLEKFINLLIKQVDNNKKLL